jgi:hypothetical protein
MRGTMLVERYGSGFIDYFYDYITVNRRADGRLSVFLYVDGFDEMGKQRQTELDKAVALKTPDDAVAAILRMLNMRSIAAAEINRDDLLANAVLALGKSGGLELVKAWDNAVSREEKK